MRNILLKVTIAGTIGLHGVWLVSCVALPQPPAKASYPGQLTLTKLADGLNPRFGIKAIGTVDGLDGSLCWVGPGGANAPLSAANPQGFIVQRVKIKDGKVS